MRIDPPVQLPFQITRRIRELSSLLLPQFTAQLILTLPCVFLNLAIVKLSCYCSVFLFASFIPSVSGVSVLDTEQAYVFITASYSVFLLVDQGS